jgi:hypothetical protein
MFFSRLRRRNKIKKDIYKRTQLNNQLRQFDNHIAKLNNLLDKYVSMAVEGKRLNNDSMINTGVKYSEYLKENIGKIISLKTSLEIAKLNIDNQEAYNSFLKSVSEFTDEAKRIKKPSKFSIWLIMNRFRKGSKNLSDQVVLIDRKIGDIERNMEKMLFANDKLEPEKVKSFFDSYDNK